MTTAKRNAMPAERGAPRWRLPAPGDLPPAGAGDVHPEGSGAWRCRHCGRGEEGIRLTRTAEVTRCRAHEARCPGRPAHTPLTDQEQHAVEAVWLPVIRRHVAVLDAMTTEARARLGLGDQAARDELAGLQVRRAQVTAELTRLGL